MRLWTYLKEAMLARPGQTVCENGASMTYEEMVVFAESFSQRIAGEACCAVLCSSEMAASMALLSCFAAGVTAVPLSPRYGELSCNKILDKISPTCVITDQDSRLQAIHIKQARYSPPRRHPALIMCTSGTTGTPKGAMLSEKNILLNVKDIGAYFAIGPEDRILIARPLYHCAVLVGEFLTALVKGTNIRFFSGTFNPGELLHLIKEHSITALGGTPTLLGMMARFLREPGSLPLKHIAISGECMGKPVGKQIAAAFKGADIYHVYGLTEAGPRVSFLPPGLFNRYPDCVGIPLPSVSLKITDKDGQEVPDGTEGMLWVKSGSVMMGYYHDPAYTAKALQNGWLCTGDIALINEAGLLKIKGRSDDLIIRAGMNIYPQEIESAVKMDDRVKEALAYAISGPGGSVQIGLKVVGDFSSPDEVKKLCAECLPAFQQPARIELTDKLPKNGSGKMIRGDNHA